LCNICGACCGLTGASGGVPMQVKGTADVVHTPLALYPLLTLPKPPPSFTPPHVFLTPYPLIPPPKCPSLPKNPRTRRSRCE
jgi:hypothetical protein